MMNMNLPVKVDGKVLMVEVAVDLTGLVDE
jgi:hypothetical protein